MATYHSEQVDENVGANNVEANEQKNGIVWKSTVIFANTFRRQHGEIMHQEILAI